MWKKNKKEIFEKYTPTRKQFFYINAPIFYHVVVKTIFLPYLISCRDRYNTFWFAYKERQGHFDKEINNFVLSTKAPAGHRMLLPGLWWLFMGTQWGKGYRNSQSCTEHPVSALGLQKQSRSRVLFHHTVLQTRRMHKWTTLCKENIHSCQVRSVSCQFCCTAGGTHAKTDTFLRARQSSNTCEHKDKEQNWDTQMCEE